MDVGKFQGGGVSISPKFLVWLLIEGGGQGRGGLLLKWVGGGGVGVVLTDLEFWGVGGWGGGGG